MNDSAPVTRQTPLWGRLSRGGKVWPVPIESTRPTAAERRTYHDNWHVVDELFSDDQVSFRACPHSRQVMLELCLFPTPAPVDGVEARLMPDNLGVFVLGRVVCERCGLAAIHDVLLSTVPRSIPADGWFLVRQCIRCGYAWPQPGQPTNRSGSMPLSDGLTLPSGR